MREEEESGVANFGLPEEVLEVLPSDPFEQLDVARKITSIALSMRVSALESESSALRAQLSEKDALIAELQSQIESLDAALSEKSEILARADQEKETLLQENASLSNTVKKLTRDVSKLEVFRKTLMQSLHEEESSTGSSEAVVNLESQESLPSAPQVGEDDLSLPPSKYSSIQSNASETVNPVKDEPEADVAASRPRVSNSLLLASQTSTPRLTPPGSPPISSASVSPTRTSKPVSPKRHSMSFSVSRGMFDRTSMYSSVSSNHSSVSSPHAGAHTGRTRVDGKEFFRQVRSRLSYEQFSAFLTNVKELNAHKQTKEETLRKADEIFGPDNKDLFTIFEGLITRNVH
ncbi:uncharacterized protein At4g15545-like isoform X1 [Cucurbita pepo subsp. pepo]|uniref:uncharacterized protein At4g15545-like isoform X1 n=1 Tax=Cucurbita pepo subsp. pepo TaxID=3664 RepID=UPI000C9D3505|nr:uncharacterized protein At4g15545-like isoform X1 [Cucurbita pepo subsp. pepo]